MDLTLQTWTLVILVACCLFSTTLAFSSSVVAPTPSLFEDLLTVSGYSATPIEKSSWHPPVSTSRKPEENDDEYKALLVALAVISVVAALSAILFFFLYLRTSRLCLGRMRRRQHRSANAFQFENIGSSIGSPRRGRLASLSSIRRQAICKSEPISIMAFGEHVKRLHADSDYLFSMEYEAVGAKKYLKEEHKSIEFTFKEGKKPNNSPKNRYIDILPYDHSRVVLTEIEGDPDSVYINANYVDSYCKPRAYIAAQGPLSASLSDFWRMIWESNARVIVMVTNLFERLKSKCVQYWPDEGSADYGVLRVTMMNEEVFALYVIRTLFVELLPNQTHYSKTGVEGEPRLIKQFQLTEWPDHDVPLHPVYLLSFLHHSKAANPPDAGPLVVHCSAGVGRSGAYIVVDSMKERIEDVKNVDVFNFLNHIRTQRVFLVQEESQYIFVHDCILEHINFGDTSIPLKEFHKRLQFLREINTDTKKSRIHEEFEDVERTKNPEKHKWAGKKQCNLSKNRREDILPVERSRVKLPPELGIEGADYINASFVDGFSNKREYIATQAPMVKTAECFYRMIFTMNCRIIVMILDEEQWIKDDYADLPTEDEAVRYGRFEIQLESQDVREKLTVRKLRLFSSEASNGHTVTHYHYRDWPEGDLPKDKISLINFIEEVKEHKKAESCEQPVVVHCDDGVGPTGVFCLVSCMYDQIEREGHVNVFHAAKLFRLQRPKLIETQDQYLFCYEVLDQVITRKLIAMAPDSDNDETSLSDIGSKTSPGASHIASKTSSGISPDSSRSVSSTRANGSVVVGTSKESQNSTAEGLCADILRSIADIRSKQGSDNQGMERRSVEGGVGEGISNIAHQTDQSNQSLRQSVLPTSTDSDDAIASDTTTDSEKSDKDPSHSQQLLINSASQS